MFIEGLSLTFRILSPQARQLVLLLLRGMVVNPGVTYCSYFITAAIASMTLSNIASICIIILLLVGIGTMIIVMVILVY